MELLHSAGIVQALLLAAYFCSRWRDAGALFESLLLTSLAATIAIGFLYESGGILGHPHLSRLGFLLMSLQGPLFLLAVRARAAAENIVRAQDAVFLAAPLGIAIYLVPFYLSSAEEKLAYLREDLVQIHFDCVVILYCSLINNLAAIGLAMYRMWKSGDDLLRSAGMFNWIQSNRWFYLTPFALLVGVGVISAFDANLLNSGAFSAAGAVIVLGRAYLLLAHRENGLVAESPFPVIARYQKSLLSYEFVRSKGRELDFYLDEEEPYLEPDFSLADVARRLGVSAVQASQIINRHCGVSFARLRQNLRVAAARKKLEASQDSFSVLEIAMQCGFNSKSAFHAAFQRITGKKPSQFRGKT